MCLATIQLMAIFESVVLTRSSSAIADIVWISGVGAIVVGLNKPSLCCVNIQVPWRTFMFVRARKYQVPPVQVQALPSSGIHHIGSKQSAKDTSCSPGDNLETMASRYSFPLEGDLNIVIGLSP